MQGQLLLRILEAPSRDGGRFFVGYDLRRFDSTFRLN
ncbi:MAG: hypothetical protein FD147_1700 [Chloroflexi bacterium]|nr:MAG: hypothetical protein FD147_1700 [Chloroflexota bacterium]